MYMLRMRRQGKLVRLSSEKDREEIAHRLRMRTQGDTIGQAGFREGSRKNHVHTEDADARNIGQARFRGGSRKNHVHPEDADTRKLVKLCSEKDREEITYKLRMRTQGKLVRLGSEKKSRTP